MGVTVDFHGENLTKNLEVCEFSPLKVSHYTVHVGSFTPKSFQPFTVEHGYVCYLRDHVHEPLFVGKESSLGTREFPSSQG